MMALGGECRVNNFTTANNNNNTTSSHHSHYDNDKTSQLILQSINDQMKQLQTVFAALDDNGGDKQQSTNIIPGTRTKHNVEIIVFRTHLF